MFSDSRVFSPALGEVVGEYFDTQVSNPSGFVYPRTSLSRSRSFAPAPSGLNEFGGNFGSMNSFEMPPGHGFNGLVTSTQSCESPMSRRSLQSFQSNVLPQSSSTASRRSLNSLSALGENSAQWPASPRGTWATGVPSIGSLVGSGSGSSFGGSLGSNLVNDLENVVDYSAGNGIAMQSARTTPFASRMGSGFENNSPMAASMGGYMRNSAASPMGGYTRNSMASPMATGGFRGNTISRSFQPSVPNWNTSQTYGVEPFSFQDEPQQVASMSRRRNYGY